jgi:thiamine-monophosphate kinase
LGAGVALRGLASAALDISDGLLQDVGHIAHRSHLGVIIERDKLPLSTALLELVGGGQAYEWGLGAGDDYELCFTAAAHNEPRLNDLFAQLDLPLTCVGRMTAEHAGVVCIDGEGNVIQQKETGYAHF